MSSTAPSARPKGAGSKGTGGLLRVLNWIEWLGNKLPDPFWLFLMLAGIVLLLSWILSAVGLSAVNPATGEAVAVTNLLSPEGLRKMVSEAVTNFVEFPPLGLVIVVLLGVAVAEQSGMISAALRGSVARVGPKWLTFVLALTGITGSIASDAMYVVLIPLGALAFKAAGRSPVVGLIVAFTSVAAGFNASLLPTASDALLGGITTAAAGLIDDSVIVTHALDRLRDRIADPAVARSFLPDSFTIAQLREVHEAILGRAVDAPNFRRHALRSGRLRDTGERVAGTPHRPPALYRFTEDTAPDFTRAGPHPVERPSPASTASPSSSPGPPSSPSPPGPSTPPSPPTHESPSSQETP